jgi:hypothetical protein
LVFLGLGNDSKLAISHSDGRSAVEELGSDVLIVVERVFGLHSDVVWTTSCGRMNREYTLELRLGSVVTGSNVGRIHLREGKSRKNEAGGGVLKPSMRVVLRAKLV